MKKFLILICIAALATSCGVSSQTAGNGGRITVGICKNGSRKETIKYFKKCVRNAGAKPYFFPYYATTDEMAQAYMASVDAVIIPGKAGGDTTGRGKYDLKVVKSQTEYPIKNLQGRGVRFDVFARDSKGREYDIEIQRANDGSGRGQSRGHNRRQARDHVRDGEADAEGRHSCAEGCRKVFRPFARAGQAAPVVDAVRKNLANWPFVWSPDAHQPVP